MTIVGYAAMIVVASLGVAWILSVGARLQAPASGTQAQALNALNATAQPRVLPQVLLTLLVVLVAAHALGALLRRLQQPSVIGEVLAGILLGPSFLGWVAPDLADRLLTVAVGPSIGIIAEFGVILFMFLVGLELDPTLLRGKAHATVAISHTSIIFPFLLGCALALWLYPQLSTSEVGFTRFALFLGVSMSVTAFPVLARILRDRQMEGTRLGVIALTCAAVDDVSAWCLLACLVAVAQARVEGAALTLATTLAYVAVMLCLVRPLVHRVVGKLDGGRVSQTALAGLFVAVLGSALATDLIGIHAAFGAFLMGAVIPHRSTLARAAAEKIEDLVVVLLLPAFFALTGLRTRIGLVDSLQEWGFCALILLVACLGKFGGTMVAARLVGLGWRDGATLGVLMNTRGLMELIVLNVGLQLGVISPLVFAMLVLMAVVTTFATSPLLHLLTRRRAEYVSPAAVVT